MDNLTVEATTNTPMADFKPNGLLKLEGRSSSENAAKFYDSLIEFAGELNVPRVYLDINLEYINTASSKQLLSLLNTLDQNNNIGSVQVNWFYEEGDEDSVETGEMFEDSLKRIRFTYNEIADIENLRN
jgi:anti-anti-sigma regulatory factor